MTMQRLNSEVLARLSVAVAVTARPSGSTTGSVVLKLPVPLALVVTVVVPT